MARPSVKVTYEILGELTRSRDRKLHFEFLYDSTELGICTCFGDPHCYRFDDDKTNQEHQLFINDSCSYTMVTDSCAFERTDFGAELPLPKFHITVVFERVSLLLQRSFAKEIHITSRLTSNTESYQLKQGLEVIHNTRPLNMADAPFKFEGSSLAVVQTTAQSPNNWKEQGDLLEVTFTNGFKILWDGVRQFKIIAPEKPDFNICGLCGNNDGVRPDTKTGTHNNHHESRCTTKLVSQDFQTELMEDEVQTLVNSWFAETISSDDACKDNIRC
ncbi:hypothetical protein CAPTEDRAFT_191508 [Capitella teleta]|uniref:VWFD domain-containing protein n=1 Tax=Capitella teleta TaxID=283909 RepID=R7U2F8_CAPTE|nr:hypothetical protein CAPTEDRAFT_191508 [Capitella teleta]|eukprot:ELU00190.1 hypothetical protein CAPTEDRAFT_191508 [Capitella teleta]